MQENCRTLKFEVNDFVKAYKLAKTLNETFATIWQSRPGTKGVFWGEYRDNQMEIVAYSKSMDEGLFEVMVHVYPNRIEEADSITDALGDILHLALQE